MTTVALTVKLTPEQLQYLRNWGLERGLTTDTQVMRAALREVFDDFPPDPPERGGLRFTPPLPGANVVLKEAHGNLRVGVGGVVERRTRHGALVAFARDTLLVPYRKLRLETDAQR